MATEAKAQEATRLVFGLNGAVELPPEAPRWGARLIVGQTDPRPSLIEVRDRRGRRKRLKRRDFFVDFDHETAIGEAGGRQAFVDELNRRKLLDVIRDALVTKLELGTMSPSGWATVELYHHDGIRVLGDCRASFGYCYVIAYRTEDARA